MTIEEIDIAQVHNIPCRITIDGTEYKGLYRITHLIRFYRQKMKQFEFSAVVSNAANPNENYYVDPYNVRPVEGWELFIKEKLKQKNSRRVFENIKSKMIS